jgi:hypothetical protein
MQRSGGERCRHAGSSSPAPRAPCTPAAAQHQRRQAQEHHSGTAPQQGSQIGHTRHTRNHAASRRDSISAAGGRPAAASGPLLAIRWPKASQVRVSQVRCQSMQSRGRQVVFTAAMSCSRGARGCGRRWCCCHRARRWRQFIRRSAAAARRLLSPQAPLLPSLFALCAQVTLPLSPHRSSHWRPKEAPRREEVKRLAAESREAVRAGRGRRVEHSIQKGSCCRSLARVEPESDGSCNVLQARSKQPGAVAEAAPGSLLSCAPQSLKGPSLRVAEARQKSSLLISRRHGDAP